jgi:hypothetical protein
MSKLGEKGVVINGINGSIDFGPRKLNASSASAL